MPFGKDNPSYLHGMTDTPTYRSWAGMLTRCKNKKVPGYKVYGGRGIAVCERWESFSNFFLDMGTRPDGTSLDRINNDGNYEPGNCRWSTRREQSRNTSRNVHLTVKGKTQCLADWSAEAGLSIPLLMYRMRANWTEDRILSPTTRPGNPRPKSPWAGRQKTTANL